MEFFNFMHLLDESFEFATHHLNYILVIFINMMKRHTFPKKKTSFLGMLNRRPPLVRQYDQIDCGPAALLSILKYHGGDASLVFVRELCQTDAKGSSMLDLVRAAKVLGLEAYGATGEYEQLMQEKMPCIAHVVLESGLNHFIVIYKINYQRVLAGDPGKGFYRLSREEFLRIWKKKSVILFSPDSNVYLSTPISSFEWIFGHLKTHGAWIHQTLFLGLIYTMLGLLTALYIQLLIDRLIPAEDRKKIIYTGLFLFIILVIRSAAGYFRQRFLILLNKKVNIDITGDFLSHIFKVPKKFIDSRKTGDITARVNDSMKIQDAILLLTSTTIIDVLVIIGSFIFMFFIAPILAWISLVLVPIYGIILATGMKAIKREQSDVMQGYARVESSYIDSLQGIDEILSFGVSDFFSNLNKRLIADFQDKIEKLGHTRANLSLSSELAGAILIVLLLSIGALWVIAHKLLLGQMLAAHTLLANILPAIGRSIGSTISLQGANIAAQRLRDILLVERELNKGKLPFSMKESLSIVDAHFSWPRSQPLFRGLTMSLEKGTLYSLWGRSGSGKSTLTHILQRKYPLENGQLLIDEQPAGHFDLFDHRKNVCVVPQKIKLFNGTIADNIVIGREIRNQDEIIRKIRELNLNIFLSRFDNGIFTQIGEDSRKLSGGELQLLALIRALLFAPDVLIVDEGFSAVDIEFRNLIFSTLRKYAINHTVLIVTHDLRMLLKTDYVYLLQDGVIAESGKPSDLFMNQQSLLSRLWTLQEDEHLLRDEEMMTLYGMSGLAAERRR